MTSVFDQLTRIAHSALEGVYGDAIDVDGVVGVGVVIPDTNLMLGGGVQLVDGARLLVRVDDFPNLALNSEVTHADVDYIVVELDDTDSAGVRRARMAKQ